MADAEIALSTAFADGTGIIVSAGTGSIAYPRDPAGQLHRAGGYGWQLGDVGGGYLLAWGGSGLPRGPQGGPRQGSPLFSALLPPPRPAALLPALRLSANTPPS